MTDGAPALLGRAELERIFAALADRLARRDVIADLFVVGGAAMAMAYDANRVTQDVDALFVPHGVVLEEARAVGEELALPPWWLNEQASVYVSGRDDPGRRRVFEHPNLRISAASPEHIFAMKALAARNRDISDLRTLAELAQVRTVEDAEQLVRDFFPDEVLSARARAVLKGLFEHPGG